MVISSLLHYWVLTVASSFFDIIVASFLGIFVPRGSFLTIILKGDMLAQNCFQGLPLKFQAGTFGAIKFFRKKISPEVLADVYRKFKCPDLVIKPLSHHGYTPTFYSSDEYSR